MILDKTLLLKGVAGVAALGGVVGGGIAAQKGGLFSSSSNADAGVQGDGLLQQDQTEEDYGIPTKCSNASESSPCELTLEDLKKIKFEGLGGATADDVENFPSGNEKITLKIDNSSTKKYIFTNNSSNPVNIKKGSDKTVTLKANGDTEFTGVNKALKLVETPAPTTDDKGIPTKCTVGNSCQLTGEDLKKIKFQIYGEGSEDVTVTPSPSAGTITLTIESSTNKYKFNNSGAQITLKKGSDASKVVTLKGSSETEFTEDNGTLKLVEPPTSTTDDKGIPTKCTGVGATSPCELTLEDLKKIKFEGLGAGGATADEVENFPSTGQKITLKINSSSSNKYTFNNSSSSNVTLKKGSGTSAKTVILKTGETEFTVENGALKLVEAPKKNNFGLPESCNLTSGTASCSLSADNLKNIKFKVLDGGSGDVTLDPSSPEPSITLSIATSGSSKIYTFKNSGSKLTLKKGDGTSHSVTLDVGETEFTEDGDKLKDYVETSFSGINANLEKLKLPNKCKFKSTDKTKNSKDCDVTVDELKKVEFENKGAGDLTIEEPTSPATIKLGIKILKYDSDSTQYGSNINDNDPLITFKNESSRITIKGSDSNNNIVIPKKSNMEFLMKASSEGEEKKLSEYMKGLTAIPPSWGILCTKSSSSSNYVCTPYQEDKAINFFSDSSASSVQELQIGTGNKDKKIFTAEENVDDYNMGFKFKVNEVISGTPTLTANDTYEIKWSTTKKKWGYVKKNT